VEGPLLPVTFGPRASPLVPLAAAARGTAAAALARHLAARDDAALARLSGVSGPGLLLVIGAAVDLPWITGIVYLGKDPGAPSLLLPSALEPDVPASLFERAVLLRTPGADVPIAVLLAPPALAGAGSARPIRRAALLAFLASEEGA
jgi:hypothetical protein